MRDDQLDVPLEDPELLAEVELTTNLIIAASAADATLPPDEIDRLLGVHPVPHESGPQIPAQQVPGQQVPTRQVPTQRVPAHPIHRH